MRENKVSLPGNRAVVVDEEHKPAATMSSPPDENHGIYLMTAQRAGGDLVHMQHSVNKGCVREWDWAVGEAMLVPAGSSSDGTWDKPVSVMHLRIPPVLIQETAKSLGGVTAREPLDYFYGAKDDHLRNLATILQDEARLGNPNGEAFVESLSTAVAIHLLRRYGTATPTEPLQRGLTEAEVRRVSEYVRENLDAALSLTDAAQHIHTSPYHFARQFRATTGQSFHQYVIEARLSAAKRLLTRRRSPSEPVSIAQVAAQVGFAHQSHLALHLRRQTGLSPRQFREQALR